MPSRMFVGVHRHTRGIDYAPSIAVIANRINLARRQTRVHGHGPSVQSGDCQHNGCKFPAVFTDDHDSIASAHSSNAEPVRTLRDDSLEFPIRPAAVWINNSFMIGQLFCPGFYDIGDAHGWRSIRRNAGWLIFRNSIYNLLRSFSSMKATVLFTEAKMSVVTSSSSTAMSKRSWTNTTSSITPWESITLPNKGVSSLSASLRPKRNFSVRKLRISCSISVACICILLCDLPLDDEVVSTM